LEQVLHEGCPGRICFHQARRTERRGFLLHGARGFAIVAVSVIAIVAFRGELKPLIYDLEKGTFAWAIAGGVALTVAVTSLFHALSLGPANVVVPIYGMFIVGGSLLGVLFLGEPMTWYKIVGLAAAVIGVVLISF
jgi:bacterial/archaeal transporter family protein